VYEIDRGLAEAFITDVFAFSASGLICPPMLIYPCQRIRSEITKAVREDLEQGHILTEGMTTQVFYEYIGHVFAPKLGKLNVIHVRALINSSYNKTNRSTNVRINFYTPCFGTPTCFEAI
jgi:hypothetical protein